MRSRKAIGALAILALAGAILLGVGCGGGDDNGSERAVGWGLAPPVGPNWIRISAVIEACIYDQPLLEEPIIEYRGNRVYIELRHTPEDGKGICFLNLVVAFKKVTFERDLDELVIFDASTDPPERRWPTEHHSAERDETTYMEFLRPVRWKVYGPPIGRRVEIISEVGYCAGSKKPRIGDVHVVERARQVLLTAMLTVPSSGRGEGCAGVDLGVHKIVRLKRPLGGRVLYDASLSPPVKR